MEERMTLGEINDAENQLLDNIDYSDYENTEKIYHSLWGMKQKMLLGEALWNRFLLLRTIQL